MRRSASSARASNASTPDMVWSYNRFAVISEDPSLPGCGMAAMSFSSSVISSFSSPSSPSGFASASLISLGSRRCGGARGRFSELGE